MMLAEQGCARIGVVFFQAEDGIRDLVRSRGLGDVYKRQALLLATLVAVPLGVAAARRPGKPVDHVAGFVLDLSLIHI